MNRKKIQKQLAQAGNPHLTAMDKCGSLRPRRKSGTLTRNNGGYMKDFYCYKQLTKNKSVELQSISGSDWLFGIGGYIGPRRLKVHFGFFSLYVSWKCDHAGVRLESSVPYANLYLQFYDHRHWDDEKGQWKIYDGVH